MNPRRFPVLGSDAKFVPSVPWDMLAPHEAWAKRNHSQTLERLAERGGLCASEMLAILGERPWRHMAPDVARVELTEAVDAWNATLAGEPE